MANEIDYRHLFARTLTEMCCEIFPAHGINSMPDTEFDEMISEITRKCYLLTVGEFRKQTRRDVMRAPTMW